MKKKWFVILNPHAGSGRGKKDKAEILNRLSKSDFQFELAISEYPKHTIKLTIQAIRSMRQLTEFFRKRSALLKK